VLYKIWHLNSSQLNAPLIVPQVIIINSRDIKNCCFIFCDFCESLECIRRLTGKHCFLVTSFWNMLTSTCIRSDYSQVGVLSWESGLWFLNLLHSLTSFTRSYVIESLPRIAHPLVTKKKKMIIICSYLLWLTVMRNFSGFLHYAV
jgi:hypothetical protein